MEFERGNTWSFLKKPLGCNVKNTQLRMQPGSFWESPLMIHTPFSTSMVLPPLSGLLQAL